MGIALVVVLRHGRGFDVGRLWEWRLRRIGRLGIWLLLRVGLLRVCRLLVALRRVGLLLSIAFLVVDTLCSIGLVVLIEARVTTEHRLLGI
jgi:hypothetical protein